MSKLIGFRVDDKLEARIRQQAAALDVPVSEFLRHVVVQALETAPADSPYEAVKHLIGVTDSGRDDLSERHSSILKEKLRAKHTR